MARWDAIVIGAGHNGLVAAFYLARARRRVLVLERHTAVGGCAVTEEFHPGFRNSVASYTVSLLQPKVITDMGLAQHGLRIVRRPMANFLPLPDGDALSIGNSITDMQAEFARFDRRDAEALPDYLAMIGAAADQLRRLALSTPPGFPAAIDDWLASIPQIFGLARLPLAKKRDLLALFTRSAEDVLAQWFHHPAIRAAFAFDSVVGAWQSPRTPGSAYVLLHHLFGEVNGEKGAWGHAIGGMGAISEAMARAATKAGATIRTGSEVARLLSDGGAVAGVELAGGERIHARTVVANVDPHRLLGTMLEPGQLDSDTARRVRAYRMGSGVFRMNVALAALPRFAASPQPGPHLSAGIIFAPSIDYMHQALRDAETDGWSRRPIVEMLIPSTLDDSLAPPGQHVASLFAQQFAWELPDGRQWTETEETAAADSILDTVERAAPGFRSLVVGRQLLSPAGLERRFGLTRGDIFHGAMGLDQLWAARPILGLGNYRMPMRGLYLCGSGSHPGGGVTGAPGHNAARAILRERRGGRAPD